MSDLNPRLRVAQTLVELHLSKQGESYDMAGGILGDLTDEHVQALAEICEMPGYGAVEAWAIVRELAETDPLFEGYPTGDVECHYCTGPSAGGREHTDDCLWQRAVDMRDNSPTLDAFMAGRSS